jgi:two-component system, response regulator PdtaR
MIGAISTGFSTKYMIRFCNINFLYESPLEIKTQIVRWDSDMQTSKYQSVKHSLLLVDDNRLILAVLSKSLLEAGYQVMAVQSVDDAEGVLASGEFKFDMAILDCQMLEGEGLSLAARLNTLDNIPFMMLSARSDPAFVGEANKLGAMSYLVKPIEIQQLIPAIDAAIARAIEMKSLRDDRQILLKALENEREINVAIGLAMIQSKLPRKEAFEQLRSKARALRVKLADVAKEVIQHAETDIRNLN